MNLTWLFDVCSSILWGFMFKSIILVSLIASASDDGTILWFCCISPNFIWGSGFAPLLVPPGFKVCETGLSAWPGLSPGNYRTVSDTAHFLRKVKGMIKKTNALQIVRHIYLNSLPKKKVSSMCSFTSNMNNDITLQTKGSSICLAIEEGCIYPDSSS